VARIRYIKPGFFADTTLSDLPLEVRYFYIGLFCQFDRIGLTPDDPKFLKREIYPYDDSIKISDVEEIINQLIAAKRLMRLTIYGSPFLFCPTLVKHQKFHRDERPRYISDEKFWDTYTPAIARFFSLDPCVHSQTSTEQDASTLLAPSQEDASTISEPNRSELTSPLKALVTGNCELVTERNTYAQNSSSLSESDQITQEATREEVVSSEVYPEVSPLVEGIVEDVSEVEFNKPYEQESSIPKDKKPNEGGDPPPKESRHKPPKFDLEMLYKAYPRKQGKTKGLKRLSREIKTQTDFENFQLAVSNYNRETLSVENQYKKHFSSFVSEWRDWITPEPDQFFSQINLQEIVLEDT
jgi:hypothetical protein